jgi:hypothetical protein
MPLKTYGGREDTAPAFLSSALHRNEWSASRPPLDRRLGGVPIQQSGRCGEEKSIFPLTGIETRPSSPSLYLLSYVVSSCRFILIKFTFISLEDHKFSFPNYATTSWYQNFRGRGPCLQIFTNIDNKNSFINIQANEHCSGLG